MHRNLLFQQRDPLGENLIPGGELVEVHATGIIRGVPDDTSVSQLLPHIDRGGYPLPEGIVHIQPDVAMNRQFVGGIRAVGIYSLLTTHHSPITTHSNLLRTEERISSSPLAA